MSVLFSMLSTPRSYTPPAVPEVPDPPTSDNIIYTEDELALWRERWEDANGWRGDKADISLDAARLISNKFLGRYTGPNKTSAGVTLGPNDPIQQHSKPEAGNAGSYIVRCAFRALIGNKIAGVWYPSTDHVNAAKIAILDACPYTTTQGSTTGLDFRNENRWKKGVLIDVNPGFTTMEYVTQVMVAYLYMREFFLESQRTLLEQWFDDVATWFSYDIGNATNKAGVNSIFVDRWNGNYNFAVAQGKDNGEYTHDGGYLVRSPQKIFNNRRATIARGITLNGFINNNEEHKKLGRLFFQDHFKYGTYGNGFFSDMERGWKFTDHERGLAYSMAGIAILGEIADLFWRSGDASLYQYTTNFGVYGTEGTGKGLYKSMKIYSEIFAKSVYFFVNNQLLDGVSNNWISAQDLFFSKLNRFYKDLRITQIYKRQLPGQNPVPASPAKNGDIPANMGPGGIVPGYSLMYEGIENLL